MKINFDFKDRLEVSSSYNNDILSIEVKPSAFPLF